MKKGHKEKIQFPEFYYKNKYETEIFLLLCGTEHI